MRILAYLFHMFYSFEFIGRYLKNFPIYSYIKLVFPVQWFLKDF